MEVTMARPRPDLAAHQVVSLLDRAIAYRAEGQRAQAWGLVELVRHRAAQMVARQDHVLDSHANLPGLTPPPEGTYRRGYEAELTRGRDGRNVHTPPLWP